MVKKNDNLNLENLGKGILDNLEQIDNIKKVKEQEGKTVNNEKGKTVKEDKNNGPKIERHKRSFVLTDDAVQKLYELKLKWVKKDLSQIVEEAIIKYYEESKDQ